MDTPFKKKLAFERLIATQIASPNPEHCRRTRFGTAILDPLCPPDRNDLMGCHCHSCDIEEMLAEVGALYAGAGMSFDNISGHDKATYAALKPQLESRGWRDVSHVVMVWETPPERAADSAVEIETIEADELSASASYLSFFDKKSIPIWRYLCANAPRLGGEQLVGWLDGEPAGIAGWYVVDGVVRFRAIVTVDKFRNRGVATALIRHVQGHSVVRAQEALVIMTYADRDFPRIFYERMGFRVRGSYWKFKRDEEGAEGTR